MNYVGCLLKVTSKFLRRSRNKALRARTVNGSSIWNSAKVPPLMQANSRKSADTSHTYGSLMAYSYFHLRFRTAFPMIFFPVVMVI